jgi:RNA polymerase sigma factor (TIGR02999 family)
VADSHTDSPETAPQTSRLLGEVTAGRAPAAELLPLVYGELRKLAGAQLARLPPGQTLQATALVHEAFVKLVGTSDPGWEGRGHFFGAAAQAMREIIVDHLRRKGARKRGGGQAREELDADRLALPEGLSAAEVLGVDAALERLGAEHPRRARVVLLRYFAGLTTEEVAGVLGVTTRTVEREWRFARAFLFDEMERQ